MPRTEDIGAKCRARIAALTHPGSVRPNNEDCLAVGGWIENGAMTEGRVFERALDAPLACLVADGLGGHVGGEVASEFVARRLPAALAACGANESCAAEAIRHVNARLYSRMFEEPWLAGMGTVMAGVVLCSEGALAFNVGDSRVYRVHGRRLVQLSIDDASESGEFLEWFGMRSGMVTQSIGGNPRFEKIEPHVAREPLVPGATYLVCSDGLYDMLTADEIKSCLSDDLALAVKTLFDEAMEAGGRDNITILLARIEEIAAPR